MEFKNTDGKALEQFLIQNKLDLKNRREHLKGVVA